MTAARRPRLILAAASMAAVAALLSACGNQQAGAAATLGDTRITERTLSNEVQAVLAAKGQPTTSVDQALPPEMLSRLITIELVDELAAREGIVVTQGQIDEQLANYEGQAGDRAAVEKLFIEQGVAPSQIESIVKLNIQAQEVGFALAGQRLRGATVYLDQFPVGIFQCGVGLLLHLLQHQLRLFARAECEHRNLLRRSE